ncbi:unnamed protein product [Acanthoscelides obtectus]|uniref:Uncharacterized protein n=1 Tax=Acanthoscelides obtectus TaxID=200917 RepID=A0A9P0LAC3_ACAOB|nr:unnamed protein product [Acanthoscelides obtectus]CAK1643259.1 hypothetical protein AOBTE_LOCUS13468 [Acanthoscelides obtectus]
MEEYHSGPNNIYNVDESALSTVQKPSKIFATKGKKQIGKIFSVAYGNAAATAIACSGFAKTGIFPFNSDIFPDYLFMLSSVTDHPHVAADTDQCAGPTIQKKTNHYNHKVHA